MKWYIYIVITVMIVGLVVANEAIEKYDTPTKTLTVNKQYHEMNVEEQRMFLESKLAELEDGFENTAPPTEAEVCELGRQMHPYYHHLISIEGLQMQIADLK